MVSLRYANKSPKIKPKKSAIEVGSEDKLIETFSLISDAVLAGELDDALLKASEQRAGRFRANLQKHLHLTLRNWPCFLRTRPFLPFQSMHQA